MRFSYPFLFLGKFVFLLKFYLISSYYGKLLLFLILIILFEVFVDSTLVLNSGDKVELIGGEYD